MLLAADAHEYFDIGLLERTENIVDFFQGSLLGRGEPHGAVVTGLKSCPAAPPVLRGMDRDDKVAGEKIVERRVVVGPVVQVPGLAQWRPPH